MIHILIKHQCPVEQFHSGRENNDFAIVSRQQMVLNLTFYAEVILLPIMIQAMEKYLHDYRMVWITSHKHYMDPPDLFTMRWLFSIRGWGGVVVEVVGWGVGLILLTDVNLTAYSTHIDLTEVL